MSMAMTSDVKMTFIVCRKHDKEWIVVDTQCDEFIATFLYQADARKYVDWLNQLIEDGVQPR